MNKNFLRPLIVIAGFILLWQLLVLATQVPVYILPGPLLVLHTWLNALPYIAEQTWPTVIEILLGLSVGSLLGIITALTIISFRPAKTWLMPALIISQAIPTFALAPLFVVWLGYGTASKVAITALMLFFPVTSSFVDGLRRTDPGWVDLAKIMGASSWQVLWQIRAPAALPALASGLRIATVIAPLGAVIGEWVGASRGLGFLMLEANARVQIDLMFAALLTLVILALLLYFSVNWLLNKIVPWQTTLS